jgi:hypothetical protein
MNIKTKHGHLTVQGLKIPPDSRTDPTQLPAGRLDLVAKTLGPDSSVVLQYRRGGSRA